MRAGRDWKKLSADCRYLARALRHAPGCPAFTKPHGGQNETVTFTRLHHTSLNFSEERSSSLINPVPRPLEIAVRYRSIPSCQTVSGSGFE